MPSALPSRHDIWPLARQFQNGPTSLVLIVKQRLQNKMEFYPNSCSNIGKKIVLKGKIFPRQKGYVKSLLMGIHRRLHTYMKASFGYFK